MFMYILFSCCKPSPVAILNHIRESGEIPYSAQERAQRLRATIEGTHARGITSSNGIAKAFNEPDITTPRGAKWSARTVLDVMGRCA
jgi:hypothetical protein